MEVNSKILLAAGAVLIALIGAYLFVAPQNSPDPSFAQCLTDKGVKMYGAFWCPHCNNQKEMFGDSWQYVSYVECSTPDRRQTDECKDAGITAYPTWEFADGARKVGELSLEELSEMSGCPLK